MYLIRSAEVYAPEPLGRKDVLIGFGKILKIGDRLAEEYGGLDVEVLDADGCILTPGFVDQHVHVIGAGGEAGFFSRTPEMQVSAIVRHGITTVVGLHGTDGTARNIEALYAKVCALEQEGITARMLTGSFEMPSATLTGSVRRDMIFIDKVIGAKMAVSDRRSSQPSREDIEKLLAQAYTGGLVSGKRGYTHFHMGVGRRRLDMLADIIRETEIPPRRKFHRILSSRRTSTATKSFSSRRWSLRRWALSSTSPPALHPNTASRAPSSRATRYAAALKTASISGTSR